MKRVVLLLALAAVGCGGTSKDTNVCGAAKACSTSSQCNLGDVCEIGGNGKGCCAPFKGCAPDTCKTGEYCDETFVCKTVTAKCAIDKCECHILNAAGEIQVGITPHLTLGANASHTVVAVLAVQGKSLVLPVSEFTLSVDNAASFSTSGMQLTATTTATAAPATLKAELAIDASTTVSCTAQVENLGAPPATGVRFFVFNDLTGEPVGSATIEYDDKNDGVVDQELMTDGNGQIASSTNPTGPFTVTVFKDGYSYLSVVAIDQSVRDVTLPIQFRPMAEQIGGLTGKLDMSTYYKLRKDGQLLAGFVAASFPVNSFLNFDPSRFFGTLTADCTGTPTPAGCYKIDIPGLGSTSAPVAMPGGAVLGYGTTPIKEHFDVVGLPGMRYAWAIAADVDLADLNEVIGLVSPYLKCTCDVTQNVCDANCACDLDCPLQLNWGKAFDAVMPLLPTFAIGVGGNLPLGEVSADAWQTYIQAAYPSRTANATFPKLDSGTGNFGPLQVRELLDKFVDYSAPSLPIDPEFPGKPMDGILLVEGVSMPGFGFVPLGLGAGLDCSTANCLDRANHAADFDGVVNGGAVCAYDVNPDLNRCDDIPGLPRDGILPKGHIGVYRAPAYNGLEAGEWLTLAIAAPLDLGPLPAAAARGSIQILHPSTAPSGAQTLPDAFPGFPTMPATIAGRVYTTTAHTDANIQWVMLSAQPTGQTRSTRWNMWFPSGATTFKAPAVPAGWVDPFAPSTGSDLDVPNGYAYVMHLGLKLNAAKTVSSLAANDGASFVDTLRFVDGVSLQIKNVLAQ